MLETVDLTRSLPKDERRSRMPQLRGRLFDIQKACWESSVASILVFEGWDAAGKGSAITALTRQLEPRGFRLHAVQSPRNFERAMPWLWRFWGMLPNYGEMAIFDQSWYGDVLWQTSGGEHPRGASAGTLRDITEFERTLTDDGYVLIKFFLHIARQEQAARMKRLASEPLTSWQVGPEQWERHRNYDAHLLRVEETLEHTETEWGPWTLVEATDRNWAQVRVVETVIRELERALQARGVALPAPRDPPAESLADAA